MAKGTILIVEDSPLTSQTLADALRVANFTILQAYTAAEGLHAARAQRPDLILMDVQLPDGDGIALAETLKSDPATAAIPIVVITSHDIDGAHARIMSRTTVGFLQKPVRPRQLLNLVTFVLSRSASDPPSA